MPVPPRVGDDWRVELVRVQHEFDKSSGQYVKDPTDDGTYAAWSPIGVVNCHRPDKMGM